MPYSMMTYIVHPYIADLRHIPNALINYQFKMYFPNKR